MILIAAAINRLLDTLRSRLDVLLRLVRSDAFSGSGSSVSSFAGSCLAVLLRLRPDRLGGSAASSSFASRLAVLLRLRLDLARAGSAGCAVPLSLLAAEPDERPRRHPGMSCSARRAHSLTTAATSELPPPEPCRDDVTESRLLSIELLRRLPLPALDRL